MTWDEDDADEAFCGGVIPGRLDVARMCSDLFDRTSCSSGEPPAAICTVGAGERRTAIRPGAPTLSALGVAASCRPEIMAFMNSCRFSGCDTQVATSGDDRTDDEPHELITPFCVGVLAK